jgi:hypothetical protein
VKAALSLAGSRGKLARNWPEASSYSDRRVTVEKAPT